MRTARWVFLIILAVALFYWKIVFTKQFSILWMWEPVTQSYSWYNFAAASIHKGVLPTWDPYRFSGSTFIGEMQTGLFYPLKFLVYIMPFDGNGLVSERIYNHSYVLTHALAAIFMFLLARHLRLSPFASFVAGVSFSVGGFLGNTGHPHILDSGIWLPLIVLFFLRSTEESSSVRSMFFAALSGSSLGMAVLGGGIHIVIMGGIIVATLCVVLCWNDPRRVRIFAIAGTIAIVGFLFGAIQLLPSFEYGPLSYRWIGADMPIRFSQKVPYQYLGGIARFSPRSLFTFLFSAASPGDHLPSNYFGVLPFVLAIVGVWRGWRDKWVKSFALLALIAYVYGWGEFSFLHGLLYLVPGLDTAREAGRFVLITHFAAAILVGYGIDHLFGASPPTDVRMRGFVRGMRWLVIFLTALLIAGSVQTSVTIDDSFFMSFVFIVCAYVVLELIHRDHRSLAIQGLLLFVVMWDSYEFNYPIQNKAALQAQKGDYMELLLDSRKLADFFKSKKGLFRIHFDGEAPPNIGDSYNVPMTGGMSATMLVDYFPYLGHAKMPELLNVRYTVRRTDLPGDQKPVFSEDVWRVYENADAGARAWVVHQIEIDPSRARPPKKLNDADFDPRRIAILEEPAAGSIDGASELSGDSVENIRNDVTSQTFRVHSKGRGLLVVSEVFYPGWYASIDGRPAPISRVDGILRGVVVPDGQSTVAFEYRPRSVRIGAVLSLAAILGTAILGFFSRRQRALPNK